MTRRPFGIFVVALLASLACAGRARADDVAPLSVDNNAPLSGDDKPAPIEKSPSSRIRPDDKLPGYMQLFATSFVGEGLRFNNPYRLATPLGNDAESVSLTSPYVDLGLGATFGGAGSFSHGMAFRMSISTSGVRQAVLTPSYFLYRRWTRFAGYARAGVAIVASPDATWGGEIGTGAIVYVRGGIGLAAELVGDVFYGAGTREVAIVSYPALSGQLGIVIAYEVLP